MTLTPNLALTEVEQGQADAHLPINANWRELDVVVHALVKDRDLITPPAASDGHLYIPAATATGAWVGQEGKFAWYEDFDSAWHFRTPKAGWTATIADEEVLLTYDGTIWRSPQPEIPTVGFDAPADGNEKTLYVCEKKVLIEELRFVVVGSTPSIDVDVRYGSDRSATGTLVVTAGTTVTSTTTGQTVTSLDNDTPAAGDWIWVELSNKSGTVDELTVEAVVRRR